MGMYTELRLDVSLKSETPESIAEVLKWYAGLRDCDDPPDDRPRGHRLNVPLFS